MILNRIGKISLALVLLAMILAIILWLKDHNNKNNAYSEVSQRDAFRSYELILGAENAPVSLVMYYNYSCVHCRDFFNTQFPQIKENYIDSGLVKLILRPTNLTNNANIQSSLELLLCLSKMGLFDIIHEIFLTDYNVIYARDYKLFENELLQGNAELEQCLMTGDSKQIIEDNNYDMDILQFKGTPLFLVGKTIVKGKPSNKDLDDLLKKEIKKQVEVQ